MSRSSLTGGRCESSRYSQVVLDGKEVAIFTKETLNRIMSTSCGCRLRSNIAVTLIHAARAERTRKATSLELS